MLNTSEQIPPPPPSWLGRHIFRSDPPRNRGILEPLGLLSSYGGRTPGSMRSGSCRMIPSTREIGSHSPEGLLPGAGTEPGIWGKAQGTRGTQATATPGWTVAKEGQHFIVCIVSFPLSPLNLIPYPWDSIAPI